MNKTREKKQKFQSKTAEREEVQDGKRKKSLMGDFFF